MCFQTFVQGRRCGSCQEGYFYLDESNQQGCLACFCMGITTDCTSSSYSRDTVSTTSMVYGVAVMW